MDTQSIRAAFLSAPEKIEDVETPDWLKPYVDADTQLAIKDIPSTTLTLLRKQHLKSQDQDEAVYSASIICNCLINKATGEIIFAPTDRDALAALGSTKLIPLADQIGTFLGYKDGAVAEAKKN